MAVPFEPELLLQHAAQVRALARRVVFDAELAEEVEQETWLAALAHAPRDLRDPRAWLARVVQHAARRLSARRARRNEVELRAGAERAAAADEPSDDPSGLVAREQALRVLLAAVMRLPEPVRRAVVLHYLDGLTIGEVARRTQAPLETVRSRVKRGLELLRAELARERGSAAWSVYLVRALALAPPAGARALALAFREVAVSCMLMSTTLKLGAGAAALLVLSGWLLFGRKPRHEPDTPGAALAQELVDVPWAERVDVGHAADERRAERDPIASAAPRETASETPLTGAVVLHLTWADDRTPASEVPVRLTAPGAGPLDSAWSTTSRAGRLERRGLAPGTIVAQPLFGGLALVEVVAGATREAALEIPVGIAVRGRVEARDGAPIQGAELFLSPGATDPQYEGRIVARTDARGAFTLRTAPAGVGACPSARAAGFAPSEQTILSAAPRSTRELTLVLAEPGRRLVGRVLSPEGAPVADAAVLVGSEREWRPRARADGTAAWAAIGELVRTDAAGRFALAGVALGALPVQVRAAGHPVWRGEVARDEPEPLTVRLERGSSVAGIVRSADGSAQGGVRVRIEPELGFASRSTTSAADGSYRLGPLPPGTLTLVAERPARGLQLGGAARATTTLALAAGAESRWDPELPPALELHGRIEAPGLDLAGWTVRGWRDASAGSEGYVEEVRTDTTGRFVLVQPPESEIGLALSAPTARAAGGGAPFPVARLEHVVARGPEVVLRVDPAKLPACTVTGALVDSRGEPVRSADVRAVHASAGTTLVHPDPDDGTFELGPLPPGEWTLEIDALVAGWAVERRTRALAPSERWDTGEVRLGPGGTLVVRLGRTRAPDAPQDTETRVSAQLLDQQGRAVAWLAFESEVAHTRPLAPGSYRLVLTGSATGAVPAREVVIVAGQETELELEFAARAR